MLDKIKPLTTQAAASSPEDPQEKTHDAFALHRAQEIINEAAKAAGREPIFPACDVYQDNGIKVRFFEESVIITGIDPSKINAFIQILKSKASQPGPLAQHKELIDRLNASTATPLSAELEQRANTIGQQVASDFLSSISNAPVPPAAVTAATTVGIAPLPIAQAGASSAGTPSPAAQKQSPKPWDKNRLPEMRTALSAHLKNAILQKASSQRRTTTPARAAAAVAVPFTSGDECSQALKDCFEKGEHTAPALEQRLKEWSARAEKTQDDAARSRKVKIDVILKYFSVQRNSPDYDAENAAKAAAEIQLKALQEAPFGVQVWSINDLGLKLKGKT